MGCRATYSLGDELSSAARDSALLDNHGTLARVLSDNGSDSFESSHIRGATGTDTTLLGRGVHGDEDNIGFTNALGYIGGEVQVWLAGRNLGIGGGGRVAGNGGTAAAIAGNTDNVL